MRGVVNQAKGSTDVSLFTTKTFDRASPMNYYFFITLQKQPSAKPSTMNQLHAVLY